MCVHQSTKGAPNILGYILNNLDNSNSNNIENTVIIISKTIVIFFQNLFHKYNRGIIALDIVLRALSTATIIRTLIIILHRLLP
jgi:hypothetical protein